MVWVRLRWRLQSPLLPIGSACSGHGGNYREVEKEIFLRVWLWCGEYRAVCDMVFC